MSGHSGLKKGDGRAANRHLHAEHVRAQHAKIYQLFTEYDVTLDRLATRFNTSTHTIKLALKLAKKERGHGK